MKVSTKEIIVNLWGGRLMLPLLKVQIEMNKNKVIQTLVFQPVPGFFLKISKHAAIPLTLSNTALLT